MAATIASPSSMWTLSNTLTTSICGTDDLLDMKSVEKANRRSVAENSSVTLLKPLRLLEVYAERVHVDKHKISVADHPFRAKVFQHQISKPSRGHERTASIPVQSIAQVVTPTEVQAASSPLAAALISTHSLRQYSVVPDWPC